MPVGRGFSKVDRWPQKCVTDAQRQRNFTRRAWGAKDKTPFIPVSKASVPVKFPSESAKEAFKELKCICQSLSDLSKGIATLYGKNHRIFMVIIYHNLISVAEEISISGYSSGRLTRFLASLKGCNINFEILKKLVHGDNNPMPLAMVAQCFQLLPFNGGSPKAKVRSVVFQGIVAEMEKYEPQFNKAAQIIIDDYIGSQAGEKGRGSSLLDRIGGGENIEQQLKHNGDLLSLDEVKPILRYLSGSPGRVDFIFSWPSQGTAWALHEHSPDGEISFSLPQVIDLKKGYSAAEELFAYIKNIGRDSRYDTVPVTITGAITEDASLLLSDIFSSLCRTTDLYFAVIMDNQRDAVILKRRTFARLPQYVRETVFTLFARTPQREELKDLYGREIHLRFDLDQKIDLVGALGHTITLFPSLGAFDRTNKFLPWKDNKIIPWKDLDRFYDSRLSGERYYLAWLDHMPGPIMKMDAEFDRLFNGSQDFNTVVLLRRQGVPRQFETRWPNGLPDFISASKAFDASLAQIIGEDVEMIPLTQTVAVVDYHPEYPAANIYELVITTAEWVDR